jgi:hypothetical protein
MRALGIAAIFVGLVTSAVGAYNPWPPVNEAAAETKGSLTERVRSPFVANLLCVSAEVFPNGWLHRWLVHDVYGEQLARDYLRLAASNLQRKKIGQ